MLKKIIHIAIVIILYNCLIGYFGLSPIRGQSSLPHVDSGVAAFISGEYMKSLREFQSFLKTSEQLGDNQRHALLMRTALIAAWNVRAEESDSLLSLAEGLEEKGIIPDSASKADLLMINSIGEFGGNHLTKAADLLIESIKTRKPVNDFERSVLAISYGFLGLIYKQLEDYETSKRYYNEAIRINRELNRLSILAIELTELASSLTAINPYDPAIEEALEEALDIYRAQDNFIYQAYVNNEYCILYQKRNNLPKALEHILESARLKELSPDRANLDITYNNIGALYESMNRTDSSIIYIKKAIKTAGQLNKKIRGDYYNNLGARFGKMGQLDSAIHYFDMAVKQILPEADPDAGDSSLYKIINPQLPVNLAGRANVLYNSFLETGNVDDLRRSIQSYNIALHQLDTLRFLYSFENKPHAVRENRKYYFLALQSAAELYRQTLDLSDLENAFLLASRSKGFVFDEYLRINEARDFLGVNPDLIRRDDSLKILKTSILRDLYRNEALPLPDQDSISSLRSGLFDVDESLMALNREIKERNPAYYQIIHSMPLYSSALVRSRLKENELLIDYTWHKDRIIVFSIGHDILELTQIEVPKDLRYKLGSYRKFLEGWPDQLSYKEFLTTSSELYQILINPIDSIMAGKDIFIIADDSLALLPFETLLYKAPGEAGADYSRLPYLIRKNAISYYHSVQQFVLNSGRSSISSEGVSAFAPFMEKGITSGNDKLEKLTGSKDEIKSIKKQLPSRIFRSGKATEAQFRNEIGKPRIVHAATHGLQADSIPLQNHLLFYPESESGDNKLHLFELLGMQVKSPLVVLSSCNTGAGVFQPGEGVLSLARAFHFAGTPALLMSLWPFDDKAAAFMMDEFYAGLRSGLALNKAVQKAKVSYLDQAGKVTGNPYYWSSLQLTGFSGQISLEKPHSNLRLLATGALVMGIVIILLAARLYLRRKTK